MQKKMIIVIMNARSKWLSASARGGMKDAVVRRDISRYARAKNVKAEGGSWYSGWSSRRIRPRSRIDRLGVSSTRVLHHDDQSIGSRGERGRKGLKGRD